MKKEDKDARRAYGVTDQGKRKPSVTEILNNLGWKTNGLIHWAYRLGREGKSLNERDNAAAKGSATHELALDGAASERTSPEMAEEVRPNADRITEFIASQPWEIIEREHKMICSEFGGTADLIVKHKETGAVMIVDLKTGRGVYDEVICQLAGYAFLYNRERPSTEWAHEGAVIHAYPGKPVALYHVNANSLYWGGTVFKACLAIETARSNLKIGKPA